MVSMAMMREAQKPEEELAVMPKVMPIIKPIDHTIRDAAKVSQIALAALSPKLQADDPVRLALNDASKPKNIERVELDKSSNSVYTMEIYLKGKPMYLTVGVSPERMVVTLTDKATSQQVESVIQEGRNISVNKAPEARYS